MKIYVGNLSYEVADRELESAFAKFGAVTSAKVIMDMDSGRSKGFGFVEMDSKDEAEKALKELNGTDLMGRTITVNEARPRNESFGGGSRSSGRRF